MGNMYFSTLVCVCFLLGVCQNSEARITGCERPKPNPCVPADNECPNGTACLHKSGDSTPRCWPCSCRDPGQCYFVGNNVKCGCQNSPSFYGDNCECPIAGACPPGWLRKGRSCYFFDSATLSWNEAKPSCASRYPLRHSSLAIVESVAEHNLIRQELNARNANGDYWIDGRYVNGGYQWGDNTGVPGNYGWATDLPGTMQGCMKYDQNSGDPTNWAWEVGTDCNEDVHFICEIKIDQ